MIEAKFTSFLCFAGLFLALWWYQRKYAELRFFESLRRHHPRHYPQSIITSHPHPHPHPHPTSPHPAHQTLTGTVHDRDEREFRKPQQPTQQELQQKRRRLAEKQSRLGARGNNNVEIETLPPQQQQQQHPQPQRPIVSPVVAEIAKQLQKAKEADEREIPSCPNDEVQFSFEQAIAATVQGGVKDPRHLTNSEEEPSAPFIFKPRKRANLLAKFNIADQRSEQHGCAASYDRLTEAEARTASDNIFARKFDSHLRPDREQCAMVSPMMPSKKADS
jgi:hypothetical protein